MCTLLCNRSTTGHIFCIHHIHEKKWEYNEAVHQLFIDFKTAYESIRRGILYNILIEFGILKKLVRLIKVCQNETSTELRLANICLTCFPWFKTSCFVTIVFNFAFRVCH